MTTKVKAVILRGGREVVIGRYLGVANKVLSLDQNCDDNKVYYVTIHEAIYFVSYDFVFSLKQEKD